jgi:imidazolonepropionase
VTLVIRDARVLTLAGTRPRRGKALADLAVLPRAGVLVENGAIAAVSSDSKFRVRGSESEIDARGRVLMPAFVDCHTHACWAGERLDEWDQKRRGATYLEILGAGGGIMSTVRAVRSASEDALVELLRGRVAAMERCGSATIEVKSGYGLSTEHELKMLRAIARAAVEWGGTVVPTALIGHALDPEEPNFVERTIRETLPAVSESFPGITIDAYCEKGAWSLEETVRLFERARELGHPLRVHADQFNDLGMIPEAIRLGARSVDHLEASSPEHLGQLAASGTFGVALPVAGFHVDGRYADARRFVDAGGLLALATNYNPGSAPSPSMPMAIALAVRCCGLSPAEAICAATVNAAELLGLRDRGRIEAGQRADLVLLRHTDERMLAYEFGDSPVEAMIIGGRLLEQLRPGDYSVSDPPTSS